MSIELMYGDCLELMKSIPDASVDMIMCDLPYGTTACKWDTIIPFDALWEQYKRICKGAIVLTSSQPFTTKLIASNIKNFKYCWVWEKQQGTNFQFAKKQPLKIHEDICVFDFNKFIYNPQNLKKLEIPIIKSNIKKSGNLKHINSLNKRTEYLQEFSNYPRSILQFNHDKLKIHPTQKPVALMEYLINTYTNEGMTVLDNCMGSGTTGIACINTNRNFIGMEMDETYFDLAKNRIETHVSPLKQKELEISSSLDW